MFQNIRFFAFFKTNIVLIVNMCLFIYERHSVKIHLYSLKDKYIIIAPCTGPRFSGFSGSCTALRGHRVLQNRAGMNPCTGYAIQWCTSIGP